MPVVHIGVTLDCVDLETVGRFWSNALGFDGGTVLSREAEPTRYKTVVMADPEGNEFCVIRA